MYTIKSASGLLDVSTVTLYKHMEKNNIEKGKKLTDEDIKVLRVSINKIKKEDPLINTLHIEIKDLTFKLNKKDLEIEELKEKIEKIKLENRDLLSKLQNSIFTSQEIQNKNIELLSNNQKLIETKVKKSWWKK